MEQKPEQILLKFMFGMGIGICLISAYLMIKGYTNYGVVALIIGVVAIAVSSKKIKEGRLE